MFNEPLCLHFEKVPAFLAVAEIGSLSQAAKVMAISQAALSQSMKKLEDSLGVTLFIGSRSGIKLTAEGETLFQEGKKIIEQVELVGSQIRKGESEVLKRIQIGTHEALAIHFWPEVIESFKAKNPNYLISIMSGRIDQVIKQLLNGDLDMAVTVRPEPARGIQTRTLYEENLCFFESDNRKHRWKKEDLAKTPILTDNQAHLTQEKSVIKTLGEVGLFSSSYFGLNSFEAAARLAEKGVGIALLPERIVKGPQSRLKLRPVQIPGIPKNVFKHEVCYSVREGGQGQSKIKPILEFLKGLN